MQRCHIYKRGTGGPYFFLRHFLLFANDAPLWATGRPDKTTLSTSVFCCSLHIVIRSANSLNLSLRRGIRSRLCAADQTSLADLVEVADGNLFNSILYNNEHVLNRILPTKTESTY